MLAWMAVIALLSTDFGSERHTSSALVTLVRLFAPEASPQELEARLALWSWGLRKAAHVAEYAVLAVLAARWLLLACGLRGRGWQYGSVALAAAYGGLDELHQTFIASRSGQAADVLWDLAGAALGTGLYAWARGRSEGSRVSSETANR